MGVGVDQPGGRIAGGLQQPQLVHHDLLVSIGVGERQAGAGGGQARGVAGHSTRQRQGVLLLPEHTAAVGGEQGDGAEGRTAAASLAVGQHGAALQQGAGQGGGAEDRRAGGGAAEGGRWRPTAGGHRHGGAGGCDRGAGLIHPVERELGALVEQQGRQSGGRCGRAGGAFAGELNLDGRRPLAQAAGAGIPAAEADALAAVDKGENELVLVVSERDGQGGGDTRLAGTDIDPGGPAVAGVGAAAEPEGVVGVRLHHRIDGVADGQEAGGGIAVAVLDVLAGGRQARRRQQAEARGQGKSFAGTAVENAGGAAGALGTGAEVLGQEQGKVIKAIGVEIASRQNLSSVVNVEVEIVVEIISQNRLSRATQFDPHRREIVTRGDGIEVVIAISVEVADRAQRSLSGGGQAFQQEALIAG